MTHELYEPFKIKIILSDLGESWEGPMKLYHDNVLIVNITYNLVQHDQIKHVEFDLHFIKEG